MDDNGYEERIAKIKSADIGWEDHGILTTFIDLHYGGSTHQGVPGHCLDAPSPERSYQRSDRVGTAYGLTFLMRIMDACGVDRWSKVPGRTVVALVRDGMVAGLKPLPTESGEEFIFADLTAQFTNEGVPA